MLCLPVTKTAPNFLSVGDIIAEIVVEIPAAILGAHLAVLCCDGGDAGGQRKGYKLGEMHVVCLRVGWCVVCVCVCVCVRVWCRG
ncbi:uncharacterized protein BJX67DRAFT_347358 [Aspergillus lucknowensis]|uniref:Secreted protein n=1 Tax=Aspergillus lucknowensis TaxID=176173 RepID=A0ABR4LY12_9EURO